MSDILDRIRQRRNELSASGGELSGGDFDSPLPNEVISQGKAAIEDLSKPRPSISLGEKINARRAELAGAEGGKTVIATTDDGGRVLEDAQGNRSFTSSGYSTTDPERIAQIMEGATPAEVSRSGFNRDIIDQNPVAARLTKFVEGTPFVGSYLDEGVGAIAGEDAAQAVRATSQAMDEENPNESLALNLAGGVAGGAAMAAGVGPAVAAAAPASTAMRVAGGLGLGAATGGLEGTIYGAGIAEGAGREENAIRGGLLGGALGAVTGGGGVVAHDSIKAYLRRAKGLDEKVIAKEFGLSKKAAKAVKQALSAEDLSQARKVIADMGDEAMLADSGVAAGAMLDAAAQTGGQALRTTKDAVEGRLNRMSPKLTATLNDVLGKPQGVRSANRNIAQKTAKMRQSAYDAAFSKPINYAKPAGQRVEEVLERVPDRTMRSAIQEANEAMAAEGLKNQQILADIADDGSVAFREMPNTQQVHEIKVALQSIAQKETDAVTGRITAGGRRANKLAGQLRDAVNDANPLYKRATKLGGDKIAEQSALDLGSKLFAKNTTTETVEEFMADATDATKEAMRQGIRTNIETIMSEVRTVATDSNVDARQMISVVRQLSSDANKAKLTAAIGDKAAGRLLKDIDQAGTALELRAMVSQNSKTAARQSITGQVNELAEPSAITSLGRGSPVEAGQKFIQALTGATDEAVSGRKKAIFDEIAASLTQIRGKDAERALDLVDSAMKGQPLKNDEAAFVARLISQPLALTGDATGRETLAR